MIEDLTAIVATVLVIAALGIRMLPATWRCAPRGVASAMSPVPAEVDSRTTHATVVHPVPTRVRVTVDDA